MSNVLLVDTNFSSGPIYRYLIEAGHQVTVVGGNPMDALSKCVDDYVNLDYSNIENTRQLISDRKIDFLVPGCNDRSYLVCAEINSDGLFPGIDPLQTAETINNKEKFRAFATQHHLPTPNVLAEQDIGSRWPVIVKPVDAFSGRGVTILHEQNKGELTSALRYAREASKTGSCIVEDYVEGQLYSHTAFIRGGKIIVDHLVEEHGTANPFVVDTSKVIYDLPLSMLTNIRDNIQVLSNKLTLVDGLVHTQFIRNGDAYWLIEITRRCPGDLYSQLIELSTGFNYAENYTRPFLGQGFSLNAAAKPSWIMRHTLTQPFDYILGSLSFNAELKIKKWVPISQTGDRLRSSPYGRVAILFAEVASEQKLNSIFKSTLNRVLYSVEP